VTPPWRRWVALAAAIVLLDASVTFANIWPTPAISWAGAVSVELAAAMLAIALIGERRPLRRHLLAGVSLMWTALALGRYADVTAPALYGRDINLYWDIRYMPDVVRMITRVTPLAVIVGAIAAIALLLWIVYRVMRWAWAIVGDAFTIRDERRILVAMSIAVIAAFSLDRWGESQKSWVFRGEQYHDDARAFFPTPVTASYGHQIWLAAHAASASRVLPATPPMDSDLALVKNTDVFVVFIESYGAVAYERPEIARPLAAALAQFESAIRDTHRGVVSAFVASPTYGGSSWLAHVSLLSGVEVREAGTNARLLTERRDTMVRAFGRQGFRTIALMPGLRGPWPEGGFYGFDQIYGADRLAYHGPEFGWFAVPDQFSLHRLDALEVNRRSRSPLFVFFPTISPHFPFSPTPPYQPDWSRLDTSRPFDGPDLVRAYEHEPDWVHFAPGYVESMAYDLAAIAGYLRRHADRDVVMIVLGDHQPPALVSGEGAPWDVPVHIVASQPDLLSRLVSSGFRRGLTPERPTLGPMHALLPLMLDAFGERHGQKATAEIATIAEKN